MIKFLFQGIVKPDFLVCLRMGTALLVSCALLSVWPDFTWLYTPHGLVDADLMHLKQGYSAFSIDQLLAFLEQQRLGPVARLLPFLLFTYIGLCSMLFFGLFTRIAGIGLLFLHGSIFTAVPQFSYGFDFFCTIALFYCSVFPVGRYCSLDRYVFRLPSSPWVLPCLRVLQLHLCLVYFFSGFDKVIGHTWRNGEALWKAVHLPYFNQRFFSSFENLAAYPTLWVMGSWAIILLELCYPIFIWLPMTRQVWLGAILLLHAGIAIVLNLPLFSGVMVLFNISAFFFHPPFQFSPYIAPYPYVAAPKPRGFRVW